MEPCMFCRSVGVYSLLLAFLTIPANASNPSAAQALLKRIESAYESVTDYRVRVHVLLATEDGTKRTEEFLYTFKKPGKIRIDFHMPQPGTILIFPDDEGKVWVRPWGWRFLDLHLPPDSMFLRNPSGQRIDQTDFGLLIRNMGRSMEEGRRGPLEILEEDRWVRIRVLAENHFRDGKVTRYEFVIDRNTFLPAEIEERTPGGIFERRISFRNLVINTGVSDSFFQP